MRQSIFVVVALVALVVVTIPAAVPSGESGRKGHRPSALVRGGAGNRAGSWATVPAFHWPTPRGVKQLIFRATTAAHNRPVALALENEVSPMRFVIALVLLVGIALSSTIPAGAYDLCPKNEGYPDCSNRG